MAYVTGHKYKIYWGTLGIDFEDASFEISERWTNADKSVIFVHDFIDRRDNIEFFADGE